MPPFSNNAPTAELQALDAAHHLHPFTDAAALSKKGARVIRRADGVWLEDSEGHRILDGMAGLWCVAIGYGRAEMAETAARQMRELPYYNTFFQTTHPPAIALSAKLASLAPDGLDHVFYAGSGSEANDTNLRMVRHYWAMKGKPEKQVIVSRRNGYHGSTVGAGSLGGMAAMHSQGGLPIPGVHHIDQPYWFREGGDSDPESFGLARARALEEAIDQIGEDRVAAFIAEPVQGAGGVIIPPESYWPEIARICAEREILLIADEVICAFGRLGPWFGGQSYGVRPDIITFAKAVTSGYLPLGGSIVSAEIAETLASGGEFFHGYTYSGHPVACAVALENLRILEEDGLIGAAESGVGLYLRERWAALAEHPLVGEARMRGMMGALELTPDKAARADFAAEEGTIGLMCRERCFANNLVMRHVRDSMILSPPLTISREEIDILVARAWTALDETYAKAKAEGLMAAKAA
ncbi:MAG: aspartate aminotransferase family protein [Pseudomonadota bacterium]